MAARRYSLEEIQAALREPAPNDGKMQYDASLTSDLFVFINKRNLNWDHIFFRCIAGDDGKYTTSEIEFHFPAKETPELPTPQETKQNQDIRRKNLHDYLIKKIGNKHDPTVVYAPVTLVTDTVMEWLADS